MSIPAWQHKLEEVEFKLSNKPNLIVDWLLNSPVAKEIPEHVLKARLARYGYKEPEPEKPKINPLTTEERQASKQRAKKNRKHAE